MSDKDLLESIQGLEASTRGLLMLIAQWMKANDPKSKAKQQSVEAVLYLSGFSQSEIGRLLNVSSQAVQQRLKTEGVL